MVFISIKLPNGRRAAINGSPASLDEVGTKGDNEGRISAKKTSNRKLKFIGAVQRANQSCDALRQTARRVFL